MPTGRESQRVAFDVFCAVGYRAAKPRLWRAEA
jgi:hypothetical protein